MIGQTPPAAINKNTFTSKKESKEANEGVEQQSSSGETLLPIATRTLWIPDALELAQPLRTKKNNKGFKADYASAAIKKGILQDTVQTKGPEQQKHRPPIPQS